ncbi:MAG: hydrogenase nickel incorporation protein HypB [Anaerolineaceae bacterium]|nr:hydrogenase nickel incorporation protein HypB [Anaerolineaceae bacterium]
MTVQEVKVVKSILAGNDQIAARNHERLTAVGILAVNLMASPGSGKTSLIVKTIEALRGQANVGVIEGDIAGNVDTQTVLRAGASDALQINTGGGCHLEASMVHKALDEFQLNGLDMLFIENVGNLVCPTHWFLGEHMRVCLLSVPEGHDKPIKYPQLFAVSDVVVLNKIDLLPWVNFDKTAFSKSVRALNSTAPIFELSCQTGEGLAPWIEWLCDRHAWVR